MAYMSEAEGISAMEKAIADAVLGKIGGGNSKAATIADILWALNEGPQTIAALQLLIAQVQPEFKKA